MGVCDITLYKKQISRSSDEAELFRLDLNTHAWLSELCDEEIALQNFHSRF